MVSQAELRHSYDPLSDPTRRRHRVGLSLQYFVVLRVLFWGFDREVCSLEERKERLIRVRKPLPAGAGEGQKRKYRELVKKRKRG